MTTRGIPFVAQPDLTLSYKGAPLKQIYKPDFICFERIIVKLKAVKEIAPEHKAQVINYLKTTAMKLGLLINRGLLEGKYHKISAMNHEKHEPHKKTNGFNFRVFRAFRG